jgi:predicted alpha-1,2-mannosidase
MRGRALLVAVALLAAAPATASGEGLRELVDPFTGTGQRSPYPDPALQEFPGSTFPGATVPFGMVQLSPDTEPVPGTDPRQAPTGGYRYDHRAIRGFSHSHISGAGCQGKRTMGDVPFLPTVGPVGANADAVTEPLAGPGEQVALPGATDLGREVRATGRGLASQPFEHSREGAKPGEYWVDLPGVKAELTATRRTGWHRYTFAPTPQANVLVDIGTSLANFGVDDAEVRVVGDDRIEGSVSQSGFCGAAKYTLHFSARFDRAFSGFGAWQDAAPQEGRREAKGRTSGAYVRFDTLTDRDVVAKVGVSYVSVAGARSNLEAETARAGFDFDRVRAAARGEWDRLLDRVDIDGGTAEQRGSFATALYQAAVHPNTYSDADGRYRGPDGKVRRAVGREVYTQFSLWDSYRTHAQLLALLAPDRARDMLRSMVGMHSDGGWLPKWALAGQDSGNMMGDPVTVALAEGWRKGLLRGRDADRRGRRCARTRRGFRPRAPSAAAARGWPTTSASGSSRTRPRSGGRARSRWSTRSPTARWPAWPASSATGGWRPRRRGRPATGATSSTRRRGTSVHGRPTGRTRRAIR